MGLSLEDIKKRHDRAFSHNQETREKAADDLVFAWVSQWSDELLGNSQLQYRGEFDVLRKAIRQVSAQIRANPVQVDFRPKDANRDDDAELLDGIYRTEDARNTSIEAYNNAMQEQLSCGVGAWLLYNDYESTAAGDTHQVIRRRPLYEANNKVFWDPSARLLDKSDAGYCSLLHSYTEEALKDLVQELTGEPRDEVTLSHFATPEQGSAFSWVTRNAHYYVCEFFHREITRESRYRVRAPNGDELILSAGEVDPVREEMAAEGYVTSGTREIDRYRITRYLVTGDRILSQDTVPGEHIPVVPAYGERAFVEDEEHYEGLTRKAKDPQRLRNFNMSYLADITSRSPREKPVFFPEQILGFEFMYEESGADNNYPYVLQNRKTEAGEDLPLGAAATLPSPVIPQALGASLELTREAVEDVANAGLPQDIADPDVSGKAVYALQNRLDQQAVLFMDNFKHAKRRDGEIFASMAAEIYDAPRMVTVTKPDGTSSRQPMMAQVLDRDTGNLVSLNDLSGLEFEVLATIGPSFTLQKDQTLERIERIMDKLQPGDPVHHLLQLQYLSLVDGIDMAPVRKFVNRQMILQGYKEPETAEEHALIEQAAAEQQGPDPQTLLALSEASARENEGRAAIMNELNDARKLDIDQQRADNDSAKVEIDAAKAGVAIERDHADTFNKQVDTLMKLRYPPRLRQSVN